MEIQNKIPCNTERLGLLNPQMIESVSGASAFQIGHQYWTEKRVRILEANDSKISSAVIGTPGLYEQIIRLEDGFLLSKCSCMLTEEVMCHHCIAVLLEYHRWALPQQSQRTTGAKGPEARPQSDQSTPGQASTMQSSVPDATLGEVMQFMEWLRPAMRAIEMGEQVPESPKLGSEELSLWIHTIINLEVHRRQGEEVQIGLESEMRDQDAYVAHLTQQLQVSTAEANAAQATMQELQNAVATYKETLDKIGDLGLEVVRYSGKRA